jgi:hypothetical protein
VGIWIQCLQYFTVDIWVQKYQENQGHPAQNWMWKASIGEWKLLAILLVDANMLEVASG